MLFPRAPGRSSILSSKILVILKAQLKCHLFGKSNSNPQVKMNPFLPASPQGWGQGFHCFFFTTVYPVSQALSEVQHLGHGWLGLSGSGPLFCGLSEKASRGSEPQGQRDLHREERGQEG